MTAFARNLSPSSSITLASVAEDQWWANSNRDWDLNCDFSTFWDSIQTIKIRLKRSRFDLRFDLNFSAIRFEKKHFKSRQVSCLLTDVKRDAWVTEALLHFCFWCNLMPKIASLSDNDWPCKYRDFHVRIGLKYTVSSDLDYLLKISLHIYFCERFETQFEIWP